MADNPETEPSQYRDETGRSLYGVCSYCQRNVDNYDPLHRVTRILRGGRGVECVQRGDIEPHEAQPLGWRMGRLA